MKENTFLSAFCAKFLFVPAILSFLFSVIAFIMPTIMMSNQTNSQAYSFYTITKTDAAYSGSFMVFAACIILCFGFSIIMAISAIKKEALSPEYYLLHIGSCIVFSSYYFVFFKRFATEQFQLNPQNSCRINTFGIIYAVSAILMIIFTALMLIGGAKDILSGEKND